jgi:hypothetical protein
MSRFWNIFRDLAYFRISWKIQNDMIGSVNEAVNEYKKSSKSQSIQNNIEKIKDKVYNNNFNKNRIKK